MITAKNEPTDDWEFDQNKENYLLYLLDNTIYEADKRKRYEWIIKAGVEEHEYESLKYLFKCDRIDDVTMRGTYGQKDILRHLRALK